MKNRRSHVIKYDRIPEDLFENPLSEGKDHEVIGTKVLYNWLYSQEEENYYLNANVPDFPPDFSEDEALFVEF